MAKSLMLRRKIMPNTFRLPLLRLAGAAALLLTVGLAQAQYVWLDEKGVRHFSDRPPPSSVPANKVLKAPGKPSVTALLRDKPADVAAPAPGDARQASKPTLVDREAEYRKRAQERAKSEAKEAEEARNREAKSENCDNARRHKALLDTGIRVADVDEHGERRYITDEERTQRMARANKVMEACR
jgi:Domain of unknown function (DUF4124)